MNELKPIEEIDLKDNTLYRFIKDDGGDVIYRCFKNNPDDFSLYNPNKDYKIGLGGDLEDLFTHFQEFELIEPELEPLVKHPIEKYKESMGYVVCYFNGDSDFYKLRRVEKTKWRDEIGKVSSADEPNYFRIITND